MVGAQRTAPGGGGRRADAGGPTTTPTHRARTLRCRPSADCWRVRDAKHRAVSPRVAAPQTSPREAAGRAVEWRRLRQPPAGT
eukprot:4752641-Prymnesium_polylepis.1